MFALILTILFNTPDPSVLRVNQTVMTKTETRSFTREECEYVKSALQEDMQKSFDANKEKHDAKSFMLVCSEVAPLLPQQKSEGNTSDKSTGVLPIPKKGTQYKFNGAREL